MRDEAEQPRLIAEDIPLALYIHFPWCVAKCPYCDFNSHGIRGAVPEDAYVDSLIRDLDWELRPPDASRLTPHASRKITSIFMGGGTPSLFSGRAIARVLEVFAARLSFASDIEITLEANPGTVDAANFRDYRAAGVNRLSIGVQSFDDTLLREMGRLEKYGGGTETAERIRAAANDCWHGACVA